MAGAEAPPKPASERRLRRRRMSRLRHRVRRLGRALFLALGPLVVVTAGGIWYATSGRIVSTENAYVQAEHILVTPAVNGMVAKVIVQDNQEVERGQPLFQWTRCCSGSNGRRPRPSSTPSATRSVRTAPPTARRRRS